MMKVFLGLSLLLNVFLGFHFFKAALEPVIERIVVEHEVRQPPERRKPSPAPGAKEATPLTPSPSVEDEKSFQIAAEELSTLQSNFLEDLEITPERLREKEKLNKNYYAQQSAIYRKYPYGVGLTFTERRKLIELEEKLQQDYAKLFGKKKWDRYKNFVDGYNNRMLDNHKSGEFFPMNMSY